MFIGTEEKTRVAEKVLAHTIRRHASREVEITPMIGPAWEYPLAGIKVGTGFSLRRWMIPAACDWQGHALYLDADQIVFGDIAELYELAQERMPAEPDAPVVACTLQTDKWSPDAPAPQTSVMVIDCFRAFVFAQFKISNTLAWLRDNPGQFNYGKLMHAMDMPVAELPVEWNHLNVYQAGKTKLLHYTKEPEQPWYKPDHPLAPLWKAELVSALKAGDVTRADMEEALAMWGQKADWRNTNGLHPHYKKFLVSATK